MTRLVLICALMEMRATGGKPYNRKQTQITRLISWTVRRFDGVEGYRGKTL